MYVPRYYRVEPGPVLEAFVREHGFATLVTAAGGDPIASHIPLELVPGPGGARVLEGHVAKGNPQWRQIEAGARCLAIFSGPHTYVSSSWYGHENVPTWNYQAVQLSGCGVLVTDREEQLAMLGRLSRHYEPRGREAGGFDVDAMTPALRDAELKGIAAFRITVDRVEAAFKLSQNRNAEDHATVIRMLEERGDAESRAVAAAMRAHPPRGG